MTPYEKRGLGCGNCGGKGCEQCAFFAIQVLADELEDCVSIWAGVDDNQMLHVWQGPDHLCMPVGLYEAFATQTMGAVMAARKQPTGAGGA